MKYRPSRFPHTPSADATGSRCRPRWRKTRRLLLGLRSAGQQGFGLECEEGQPFNSFIYDSTDGYEMPGGDGTVGVMVAPEDHSGVHKPQI